MGNKYTEAQKRASIKYLSESTDNIQIRVKKGDKNRYKDHAQAKGVSLTALIVELLEKDIKETQPQDNLKK